MLWIDKHCLASAANVRGHQCRRGRYFVLPDACVHA